MSYLDKPRIGFHGDDAWTNPSTANNENVIHLLDYDHVKLLNPPKLLGADLREMSDVAYREWMTSLMTYDAGNPNDPQGKYDPGWAPAMPGYWNYYGDHLTTFGTASVNGVWLPGQSAPGEDDALVGARLAFNAKLVDVDPADTFSSQLISAAFSLVGPDGAGNPIQLLSGVPTIAHLRWTNFNRPYGAGTFQCVIPNDTLQFVDEAVAPASAGLLALRDGAATGGGLLLRYCLYDMQAGAKMPAMYDAFRMGNYAWNPKVGYVLGTIGVWNGSDMTTAPVGRILQLPGWPIPPAPASEEASSMHIASHADVERLHTPGTKDHATLAALPDQNMVGPAVAVVQDDVVVLDLLTTFPEQAPRDMTKVDYGDVQLLAGETEVGTVAYDRATYEAQAGIVELPLSEEARNAVADGSLVLRDQYGRELLREVNVMQVETDDRGVYLDMEKEGETATARGAVHIRVFDRGEPAADPFTLTVQVVADDMHLGVANSTDPLVVQQNQLEWKVLHEFGVDVPAGGEVDVPFTSTEPGCHKLRFLPRGMAVPDSPQFAVELYANVRVLPYHDYDDKPDEEITWDFVYHHVFRYYGILYPIMSLIIPWGPDDLPNDPVRVAQFAAIMRQAVDEKYLGTALSMPITRELDAGKRRLVQRWCDLQMRQAPSA